MIPIETGETHFAVVFSANAALIHLDQRSGH